MKILNLIINILLILFTVGTLILAYMVEPYLAVVFVVAMVASEVFIRIKNL